MWCRKNILEEHKKRQCEQQKRKKVDSKVVKEEKESNDKCVD